LGHLHKLDVPFWDLSYVLQIACFLHIYIKIRDRSIKKFKDVYDQGLLSCGIVMRLNIIRKFLPEILYYRYSQKNCVVLSR